MSTPKDKRLHLAAGAVAGVVGVAAAIVLGYPVAAVFAGIALSTAAGVAKEWYDSTGHGTVDPFDAVYTSAGGTVASIAAAVVYGVVMAARG